MGSSPVKGDPFSRPITASLSSPGIQADSCLAFAAIMFWVQQLTIQTCRHAVSFFFFLNALKVKIVKLSSPLDVRTMLLGLYGVDKHVCRHTAAFVAYL